MIAMNGRGIGTGINFNGYVFEVKIGEICFVKLPIVIFSMCARY